MHPRNLILVVFFVIMLFGSAGYFLTRRLVPLAPASPESQLINYSRTVSSPSPSPQLLSYYDLNQDGSLTMADYQLLLSLIGTDNPQADFNQSGRVDILDYHTLALNFLDK